MKSVRCSFLNLYKILLCSLIWLFTCFYTTPVWAGALSDRVSAYPDWHNKPPVSQATGDLIYPDWIAGTWHVKSTLIDLVAPLAPKIVTPGFESNRQYVNQPIEFDVRFKPNPTQVIADRAFNGLNIARAYLGDRAVLSVKVDPNSPNKQITVLRDDRILTSTITGRAIETPDPKQFITSEIFQQVFRSTSQPYLNQVETTTAYQFVDGKIGADQITAIYLSPQDPDYFNAGNTPVALYRYRLEFSPPKMSN
ncbi:MULTISPECIES: DUF6816 family protein [Leptolyngbya]|uniref:DUF6816 family protein n=1 Tax=Leptolyngbya TaxID=47251 RepID=UPI001685CD78|nr:hypothetical protein [Leptolyngbya sp. FACHB-1624]MBD1855115.1 hypothetical protein [Leptolyngbya sp. FACHB-1624]